MIQIPGEVIQDVESEVMHAQASTRSDFKGQLKVLKDEREKVKEEKKEEQEKQKDIIGDVCSAKFGHARYLLGIRQDPLKTCRLWRRRYLKRETLYCL